MKPLLSIIIPAYKAEKTIDRTLDSLSRMSPESRSAAEVIVVDDGSTDRSAEIAESKRASLLPLELLILSQSNKGLSAARNTGLRHSRGEYIFLLDSDDELALDPVPWIRQQREASSLLFAVRYQKGDSFLRRRKAPSLTTHNLFDVFTAGNALTVSSIIFRKDRVRCPFDAAQFSLEDWLFWMTNPLIFEKTRSFPQETSAIIHVHEENMSSNAGKMGKYRQRAAEMMLANAGGGLTRKQRNNLLIQARIGMIQQGMKAPVGTYFLVPCAMSLYVRLILYGVTGGNLGKLGLYNS
ncbi:MAG TPA: glycosyltransferase [Nitrospirota bacterium]|nr:glycosyltransferase [Nitrospirota bacterium]